MFCSQDINIPWNITNIPLLMWQEKAKRGAWQKLVDAKVTPQDAQKRYVTLVNELKDKYGYEG